MDIASPCMAELSAITRIMLCMLITKGHRRILRLEQLQIPLHIGELRPPCSGVHERWNAISASDVPGLTLYTLIGAFNA